MKNIKCLLKKGQNKERVHSSKILQRQWELRESVWVGLESRSGVNKSRLTRCSIARGQLSDGANEQTDRWSVCAIRTDNSLRQLNTIHHFAQLITFALHTLKLLITSFHFLLLPPLHFSYVTFSLSLHQSLFNFIFQSNAMRPQQFIIEIILTASLFSILCSLNSCPYLDYRTLLT